MTERTRQAWIVILGMCVAALAVAMVFAILVSASKATQIRATQQDNSPLIANTDRTLRIIRGCTTPGRPCYERAQKQTAAAVADINKVVIIAAACASRTTPQSVEQIQACVIDRLADR